jgi:hypothetical protein
MAGLVFTWAGYDDEALFAALSSEPTARSTMRVINRRVGMVAALAGTLAAGACGGKSSKEVSGLEQDLQRANSSLELIPNRSGTGVVSAIEEIPTAKPQKAPTRSVTQRGTKPQPAPQPTKRQVAEAPAPDPEPEVEQPTPQQATQPAPTAKEPALPAPRPATTGRGAQPAPPGGYKTVGEIIRNAPFPINP